MKKCFSLVMALILALTASHTVFAEATDLPPKPVVGIACRADTDSEFLADVCRAIEAAGGTWVMLEQAGSADLYYDAQGKLTADVTEAGMPDDAAAHARTNTRSGSAETVGNASIVLFPGGENTSPDPNIIQEETLERAKETAYTLDKVVVFSRHNIRSPLSGGGSLLGDITPHTWFNWTSASSELSLKGGVLETLMGQYFRLWLEDAGLIPENWRPDEGAVRFYANAKQRTQATARYFSAGLLPVSAVPIETHAPYDTMDDTFMPKLRFVSDDYAAAALDEIAAMGGEKGMAGYSERLRDAIALVMDVADIAESEAYQAGRYGDLLNDETTISLVQDKEPGMSGPIKTATSVADAMKLQYYEEPDELKAAFGHELTWEDWASMSGIVETYGEMLFTAPLVAVNVAHPLLKELKGEMEREGRVFSFLCGHDSNVASLLAALGVADYALPNTLEPKTPIGVKLTFERYVDGNGAAWYAVNMVYQSTEQLRNNTPLSLENPPVKAALRFEGLATNEDGLIAEADLLNRFQQAIDAFDALDEQYPALDDAA